MTISNLHIFAPASYNTVRIRPYCPICKQRRYGSYTVYYDYDIATLECGFSVASEHPIRGHYGARNGHPIWRNKPRFDEWAGWNFKAWHKVAGAWIYEMINDSTTAEAL